MTYGAGLWAVVPVKRFADAKSRLASVLGSSERHELARRMFDDVLESLLQCSDALTGIIVVTADHEAAALGQRRGAKVVLEEEDRGVNAAVQLAIAPLHDESDAAVLIVPSDLPQLSRATIEAAAEAISSPRSLAIAEASADGGTNLLACRPAHAVPLHFGPNSFVRHTRAAERAGLAVRTLHMSDLQRDIDRPDDLYAFQALRTDTKTHQFLSEASFRFCLTEGQQLACDGLKPLRSWS
ncbi:MAG: 2-phospho-L-lactate guanylyltransferase [Bryobacteraceae bacterium]